MMSTKKTYFICGLFLLLIAITLFLLGGYNAKREIIQIGDRRFLSVASTFLLSASLLPMLIACSVACGGLGCIQSWIAFPEILKRIIAYLFTAGLLLMSVAGYVRGSAAGDDYHDVFDAARWIGVWGFILLALPLLFHLYGFGRHAFRQNGGNRAPQSLTVHEEKNMKAAKLYAVGGLVLILWVLLRAFWSGWPWEEDRVVGLSRVMAGLFTWPLGAALGAAALFLAVLQSLVAIHERFKVAGGITYFVGVGVFLGSLYLDLLRERPFDNPISWTTGAGLALLLVVFLLNLVGILRNREIATREVALGAE
jgi:hypothetical protein